MIQAKQPTNMIAKKIKEDIQTSYSVDRWDKSLNLTGLSHFTGIPASVPVSLAPPVEPLPLSGQQYAPPPKKKVIIIFVCSTWLSCSKCFIN